MLRIYNTLSKTKENFFVDDKEVKMYVCGITPYDKCHIGHARCYVIFDVIKRYLEFLGFNVKHVQNFTDIDDKIIKKSIEEKLDFHLISSRYIDDYFNVMDKLNIKRASVYPNVSENIDKIIKFIEILVKKEYAYEVDGDIYYSVKKFKNYGILSGRNLDEMKLGARVAINDYKDDPLDFALWKRSKENEPFWESPWGKGRPGWHIECSVMALDNLGSSIDIHGGGSDLIFPHHENEIAQSESFTDKKFSRFWIHNGFVMINKEKMSKSLGNAFSLDDIIKVYNPMALRVFLLSNHYRKPLDFSDDKLVENSKRYKKFVSFYDFLNEKLKNFEYSNQESKNFDKFKDIDEIKRNFFEGLDDDFNTARSLASIHNLIDLCNSELDKEKLCYIRENFLNFVNILGISFENFGNKKEKAKELTEEIKDLIEKRNIARKNKDWVLSDKIRDILKTKKILVKDTKEGTELEFLE